ncbi:MAG: hypothetical protein Q9170_003251 [Blastenia crenularia]
MSFNSKNLTYDSNEPAFLKKLKKEYGGADSARHQRPLARPRKQRNADKEHDDEPIYVHETNPHETISKTEYDALLNVQITEDYDGLLGVEEEPKGRDVASLDHAKLSSGSQFTKSPRQDVQSDQRMAVIGAVSKKRSAKVIRDNASADEDQTATESIERAAKQGVKKAKKQKLSFQDN